jgi:hypothetical protein
MVSFLAAILAIAIAFFVMIVVDLVLAVPLMFAWDGVMPHVFHLPTISYWQAFAMLIVAGLLVKSTSSSTSSS